MFVVRSLLTSSLGECIRFPLVAVAFVQQGESVSHSFNTVLALKGDAWEVETIDKLPEGTQPQISVEELLMCEDIIRADERVIKLAKDVGEFCFLPLGGCCAGADGT